MSAGGMDDAFRRLIREEVDAGIGADLRALRSEIEALRAGLPPELRGLLTLEEVADFLNVKSSQTARAWCCRQGIKLRKIGASTRILGEDVWSALKK